MRETAVVKVRIKIRFRGLPVKEKFGPIAVTYQSVVDKSRLWASLLVRVSEKGLFSVGCGFSDI